MSRRSPWLKLTTACLLVLITLTSFMATAQAQYYYQPNRGYYRNDTVTGGVLGAGGGALIGAAVSKSGNRGENALIGGGVGLLAGALLGKAADNADERQVMAGNATAYQANAQVAQANAQASAQAVTNQDLADMTRAGLSDEVIINTIRSRGSRIDTSPQSLVFMKQSGVSDRVVMAAQSAPASAVAGPVGMYPINLPPPVYVAPQPVYVQPAPVIRVYSYGPPPVYYHHHHHHGW